MTLTKRELILCILLVAIGVFNVADYFFTDILVVQGGHFELNPLMRRIVYTPYFFLYKMVLVPCALWLLWRVRRVVFGRLMSLVWLTFFVYLGLMVYIRVVFYS